nr:hypothetical protein [Tanacetum cinerariifolium]
MQQTDISQPSGSGVDEGTGSKPGVPNVPTDESEEELSWNSTEDEDDDNEEKDDDDNEEDEDDDGEEGNGDDDDDEDDDGEEGGDDEHESDEKTREEESFDPIPQTPEDSEDEGDGEEDLGLNIGEEERHDEEEDEYELYRDVNINQERGLQGTLEVKETHVTLTLVKPDAQIDNDEFLRTVDENIKKIIKEQVKEQVKAQVSKILPRIEQAVNEKLGAKVLTRSSHSSRTSYVVAADHSEMELKKILIEKMKGNKSIQCSDEQRNLYKALVDAYESDKIILDTYGETVTLKRRRDDDEDK